HDRADDRGRSRKSQRVDGGHPERREYDAADASTVICHGERGRTPAYEPRRDDRIDGDSTHGAPAQAAEQSRDEQLPAHRPSPDSDSKGKGAGLRHRCNAEAFVKCRQIGPRYRADEELDGDRGGYQRHRPTPRRADDVQKDRWTVEPPPPSRTP